MADFRNLEVYQIAKAFNKQIYLLLKNNAAIERTYRDQLVRASLSICLNIAEGSGRFTNRDKRNFYVIARGSALECLSIFDLLAEIGIVETTEAQQNMLSCESISKMLFGLIQKLGEQS